VNGQKGAFGQTNYSAAKAGMHGFTKALAYEVARKGVTVNTISPGYIGTKMVLAIPKDVLDSKILPQIPVGRLGKPEEVAGLCAYPPPTRPRSSRVRTSPSTAVSTCSERGGRRKGIGLPWEPDFHLRDYFLGWNSGCPACHRLNE
jgi:NAD(P)-dependent dehydrogenase (short-subunit alcohol dehydrogenase family)